MTENLIVPLIEKHYKRIEEGGVHAAVFHPDPVKKLNRIMVLIALNTTFLNKEDYDEILAETVDVLPCYLTREQLSRVKEHRGAASSNIFQPIDVQVLVIDEADLKQLQFCDGCPTSGEACPMPKKQDYHHCNWKETYVETGIWGKKP